MPRWAPNFLQAEPIGPINFCFLNISPAAHRKKEKYRQYSSTWSSHTGLPSKYYPVPMLLDPKVAWLLSNSVSHSVIARQCDFWQKNLVFFYKYLANIWSYWVGTFAKTRFCPVPSFPPSFNAIVPIVRPAIECKQTCKQANKHADILLYFTRLAELPGIARDIF